ncbi:unnamed protein product, partial [Amoebophrya sp. A25]
QTASDNGSESVSSMSALAAAGVNPKVMLLSKAGVKLVSYSSRRKSGRACGCASSVTVVGDSGEQHEPQTKFAHGDGINEKQTDVDAHVENKIEKAEVSEDVTRPDQEVVDQTGEAKAEEKAEGGQVLKEQSQSILAGNAITEAMPPRPNTGVDAEGSEATLEDILLASGRPL